jgi:dTDP-4-amino-4,6-dideoxygalactose transaminase
LDRWNALRRRHAEAYAEALAETAVRTPETAPWAEHVWHLFVVRTPRRDDLRSMLAAEGIATGLHYPLPLHRQPALASSSSEPGLFPMTQRWADELLSLPMFPELKAHEIGRVADVVDIWTRRQSGLDMPGDP